MGTERFGSVICCSTVEMRLGTITIVNLFPKGFSISAIFESRAFFFLAMRVAMRRSSRPKWCTTEKSYAVENGLFLSLKTVGFRRRIMQSQFQRSVA